MPKFLKGCRCLCDKCRTLFVVEEDNIVAGELQCPNCRNKIKPSAAVENVVTK